MVYKFNEYVNFIRGDNIISSAFIIVIGCMISNIIDRIVDEIVLPLTNNKLKIENIHIKEYFILIANFILVTYILFLIIDKLKATGL